MRNLPNEDLLQLLSDDEPNFRMLALHFLSEGYVDNGAVLQSVFAGWDRWGVERAFVEFPMISYVPISGAQIGEVCRRASHMAQGRKLTDIVSRCAGKLLEQIAGLSARALSEHISSIAHVAAQSKIFFRVDVDSLKKRISLLNADADALMQQLENSVETLSTSTDNSSAFLDGLHALEILRCEHPQMIDMAAALAITPPDNGSRAISFQLAMHSLIQFAEVGAEKVLANHLLDSREAIHANATEALVRIGSTLAAAAFVAQFSEAEPSPRKWIARGLQRIRAVGLADEIAKLRKSTDDSALWLMLLIAEVRQMEAGSLSRIATELGRVQTFSTALMDALTAYVRIHEADSMSREIQTAYRNYLQRINDEIQTRLGAQATSRANLGHV